MSKNIERLISRQHELFADADQLRKYSVFPQYFTVEVCNNCNARCIMCPKRTDHREKLEIMSNQLFDKFVNEIREHSADIKVICLNSDGEPTLDKNLCDKIAILKGIGIKSVNFSTNASLMNEKLRRDILDCGLDSIRVSIDSIKKETFEKIRVGLNFDVIMSNILKLIQLRDERESKLEIRIRMVQMEENRLELNEWTKFWRSKLHKSDKVQIMPLHTWSGEIKKESKENINFYKNKPCISVFTSFALNYDGIVQLCDSDITQQQIIGDFNNNSIQEIWQNEKILKIRELHSSNRRNEISICLGCDHWGRIFKEA